MRFASTRHIASIGIHVLMRMLQYECKNWESKGDMKCMIFGIRGMDAESAAMDASIAICIFWMHSAAGMEATFTGQRQDSGTRSPKTAADSTK